MHSSGEGGELIKQHGKFFSCFFHGEKKLIFVVDDIRFIHIGADRDRVIQVEYTVKTILPGGVISGKSGDFGIVTGEFFPDKVLYGFIFRKDHAFLFLMAGKETVKGNDNREIHFFGKFQGDQVEIVDHLRVIRKQNDPAGI